MKQILVLNASYEPLHNVDVQHAIRMIVRKVAVIEEAYGDLMYGLFPMPKILRLIKYVKDAWKYNREIRYSKQGVLRRDKHICAFCGGHANTIDHVLPRSKGGTSTWLNTISACKPCNNKKGDRLLAECGMKLRFQPHEPKLFIPEIQMVLA